MTGALRARAAEEVQFVITGMDQSTDIAFTGAWEIESGSGERTRQRTHELAFSLACYIEDFACQSEEGGVVWGAEEFHYAVH